VSTENVRVVEEIQKALTGGDVVAALDDTTDQRARGVFMEFAEPEFEVVMVGPEYTSARAEYNGLDGFVEAWRDWTSPFDRYEIEVEEMIDAGEHVVTLVAMTGRTRTGGAEITAPAAAVWRVLDGRVRRVEFHLDRDAALRAAGIDPSSLS
jgi:ketosteroid isomerase-like protein